MKHPPSFQFYPRDFLADQLVGCMTLQERGAYITLLCHCWTEGSVPDDVARLAVLLGVPYKVALKMWPALQPCFTKAAGGRLIQKRLELVRREQDEYREQQRLKGLASGRARREHRLNRGSTAAEPSGEPDPQPNTNPASAPAPAERQQPPKGPPEGGVVAPKPKHPQTDDLAAAHAGAILAWKPDAKPQTTSASSLRAYDALLRIDARPFEAATLLVDWLFRGGYTPRPDFDWRPNVLSGGALRRQFDRLQAEQHRPQSPKRDVRVGSAAPSEFLVTRRVEL